jgi:hypothetical protein
VKKHDFIRKHLTQSKVTRHSSRNSNIPRFIELKNFLNLTPSKKSRSYITSAVRDRVNCEQDVKLALHINKDVEQVQLTLNCDKGRRRTGIHCQVG